MKELIDAQKGLAITDIELAKMHKHLNKIFSGKTDLTQAIEKINDMETKERKVFIFTVLATLLASVEPQEKPNYFG